VWIDYFSGTENAQTEWIKANAGTIPTATGDLILAEVLQGIRDDARFKLVLTHLAELEIFEMGGKELAIASANNYRYLRKRGVTIRTTIDCLIATFCIQNGHTLLHNDHDFDPFEQHLGLQVLHPA
jgi:hypothetical protein